MFATAFQMNTMPIRKYENPKSVGFAVDAKQSALP